MSDVSVMPGRRRLHVPTFKPENTNLIKMIYGAYEVYYVGNDALNGIGLQRSVLILDWERLPLGRSDGDSDEYMSATFHTFYANYEGFCALTEDGRALSVELYLSGGEKHPDNISILFKFILPNASGQSVGLGLYYLPEADSADGDTSSITAKTFLMRKINNTADPVLFYKRKMSQASEKLGVHILDADMSESEAVIYEALRRNEILKIRDISEFSKVL